MPTFFDDSDLVETDRDWIQKVLFPQQTPITECASGNKNTSVEFPFENQPVFDQTSEAEDAACSPNSLGALSNSSELGVSSENLVGVTKKPVGASSSSNFLVAKQNVMTSPRNGPAESRSINFNNSSSNRHPNHHNYNHQHHTGHRPARNQPRNKYNANFQNGPGGHGGSGFSGGSLTFPGHPAQQSQNFLGQPVYYPAQTAAHFAGFFPYQPPPQYPVGGYLPAGPVGYLPQVNAAVGGRMRTPPSSPGSGYGTPVFIPTGQQQFRHVVSQNPYMQQPFIHPGVYSPYQIGNASSFPAPINSVQIRSPSTAEIQSFNPPAQIPIALEFVANDTTGPVVSLPETNSVLSQEAVERAPPIPKLEENPPEQSELHAEVEIVVDFDKIKVEPVENVNEVKVELGFDDVKVESGLDEVKVDDIKNVDDVADTSGNLASDDGTIKDEMLEENVEEEECEAMEEVHVELEIEQDTPGDSQSSEPFSFGNFADLDIVLPPPLDKVDDNETVMEFGVKRLEISETPEPSEKVSSTRSQPTSPESVGQSETSGTGTEVFFDAVEEKAEETPVQHSEEKFEVCPESPKESRKSSSADSAEYANLNGAANGGAKCWASLFRNTKQAAEAVVVNRTAAEDESSSATGSNKDQTGTARGTLRSSEEPVIVPFDKDVAKADVRSFLTNTELNHRGPAFQLRGLLNTGNWCYVNAVLQSLVACPPFFHLMQQFKRLNRRSPTSTPILDALSGFVGEFSMDRRLLAKRTGKDMSIGPSLNPLGIQKIAQRLRADSSFKGRQEDAEEFLLALLNGLHEEMVKCTQDILSKADTPAEQNQEGNADEWQQVGPGRKSAITRQTKCTESLISQIFVGQLRYSLNQPGSKESVNVEHFFTIPLEIQDSSITDIQSAMNFFFRKETVKCASKTKTEVEAIRRGSLQELPLVLILQLKYFVYSSDSVKKLPKTISYDMDLQIPKDHVAPGSKSFNPNQRSYKLFSVVFHHGEQTVGGHYTAKIFHAGQWVEMDDARVKTLFSSDEVTRLQENSVPYLLFYRRCDLMLQSFGNQQFR